MSLRTICPWLTVLCIVVSPAVFAQSEVATISGRVADTTGGVLAGTAVTARNEATNITVSTVTDEAGRYFIPSLRPGVYSVIASRPGFKRSVDTGVTLQVNQAAKLDITLIVGETAEQITVEATTPLLETENSSRGAVIDERKIAELPLNGRDYNQLAT